MENEAVHNEHLSSYPLLLSDAAFSGNLNLQFSARFLFFFSGQVQGKKQFATNPVKSGK